MLNVVFYVDAIGTLAGSAGLVKTAGYVLILDAPGALRLGRIIVDDTWGRAILPVP